MKKLLCIALLSFAIMASTTKKNEIVANNSKEVKVEKCTSEKVENSAIIDRAGCGAQGTARYNIYREEGDTHREARRRRRKWVRKCRGGGWIVNIAIAIGLR